MITHHNRIAALAKIGAALADPGRAAIMAQLAHQPTGGTALRRVLRELGLSCSPARVSQHVTTLREAGFIASERDGRERIHRLTKLGRGVLANLALAAGDGDLYHEVRRHAA